MRINVDTAVNIERHLDNKENNLNLVRMLAACLVLISHSYAIYFGEPNLEPLRVLTGLSIGDMSVNAFFVISGFLLHRSITYDFNFTKFAINRVLRIYPALTIAVTFSVFVIGILATELNVRDYLTSTSVYHYLFKNSSLFFGLESRLPEVFNKQPLSATVNGSLWSLPYEIKMYAVLFLTTYILSKAFQNELEEKLNVVFSIALAVLLVLMFANQFSNIYKGEFLRLSYFFVFGQCIYIFRRYVKVNLKITILCIVSLILAMKISQQNFILIYYILSPVLLMNVVFLNMPVIKNYNKVGDYSYGMYLYAFPIQQYIVFSNKNLSFFEMTITSFIFTLIMAVISWHIIEAKFLKFKWPNKK
ncbi:acyltransferase [Vibrio mediterranei]|uniref:acyltransferase family protein n=1 Tax=Vibrio mediterranei TaxID=689 RepID=UPI0038CF0E65